MADISEKLDATTKYGRELITTKNDILKRVVYQNGYRDDSGLQFLIKAGIEVEQISDLD